MPIPEDFEPHNDFAGQRKVVRVVLILTVVLLLTAGAAVLLIW